MDLNLGRHANNYFQLAFSPNDQATQSKILIASAYTNAQVREGIPDMKKERSSGGKEGILCKHLQPFLLHLPPYYTPPESRIDGIVYDRPREVLPQLKFQSAWAFWIPG